MREKITIEQCIHNSKNFSISLPSLKNGLPYPLAKKSYQNNGKKFTVFLNFVFSWTTRECSYLLLPGTVLDRLVAVGNYLTLKEMNTYDMTLIHKKFHLFSSFFIFNLSSFFIQSFNHSSINESVIHQSFAQSII